MLPDLPGVSIEFRSKGSIRPGGGAFDVAFCAASTLATFLYGVSVGNCMLGLPIGPDHEFAGSPLDLIRPYPVVVGLFAVATFAMHGSIYLYLKTEGELQRRIYRWMWRTFAVFVAMYLVVTGLTLAQAPAATHNFGQHPWLWLVVLLNVLAIANIPRSILRGQPLLAFLSAGRRSPPSRSSSASPCFRT